MDVRTVLGGFEASRVRKFGGIALPVGLRSQITGHRRTPPRAGGAGRCERTVSVAGDFRHFLFGLFQRHQSEKAAVAFASAGPDDGPVVEQGLRLRKREAVRSVARPFVLQQHRAHGGDRSRAD